MKKFVAVLLCLIMILSLFSCKNKSIEDIDYISDNDSSTSLDTFNDPITNNASVNYDSLLRVYRRIVDSYPIVNQNPRAHATELGIQGEGNIEIFVNLYSSVMLFYPGRGESNGESPHYKLDCGYAQKDLNGDGVDELVLMNNDYYIMAIFSYADGKPVLLGNYMPRGSCWIDGDGLLHENGSGAADHSTNAIYKIADGGKKLELIVEYGTNGHEWIEDVAYTIYYKLVNGEKKTITEAEYQALNEQYGKYLGSVAGAEATKKHSGLTFTSLYTEAEIAMEMFEAVLDGKIQIYNTNYTNNDKYVYLKDYKSYDISLSLCETKDLGYAYIDVNGDSINELFIHHGEISIFWYHEGIVYGYSPNIANDDLNNNGSFSWRTYSANLGYGESKFVLNGSEIQTEVLWRIVNDGEPNAEYYIGSRQVTQEEILKYFKDNTKSKAEFSPLEVSWQKKITSEEALQIASEYWETEDGFTDYGAGSMWVCHIILLDDRSSVENGYYHIGLQVDHYGRDGNDLRVLLDSSMEHLFVNAVTGECHEYVPILGNGTPFYGKG